MSDRTSLVSTLCRLLSHPDTTFAATLSEATEADVPVDVWQHTIRFAWRVGDLSLDELQELYEETFGAAPLAVPGATSVSEERLRALLRTRAPSARLAIEAARLQDDLARLDHAAEEDAGGVPAEVLATISRLEASLEAAHNPYHHLLAALATLLRSVDALRG